MRRLFAPLVLLPLFLSSLAFGRSKASSRRASFVEDAEAFAFRVLEDDNGGFYAIWSHLMSDKSYAIMAQHVDADGRALWKIPGVIVEQNLSTADMWDATGDSRGGFLLTWIGDGRTRAQRISPDGGKLWQERAGVTTSSSTASTPVVVSDVAGGGFFVWAERRYADRWVLMAQHVDAKGLAVWPVEGSRVSLRASDQRRPVAIYDGSAGIVVAWKDFRNEASQLQVQRLDFQGNQRWSPEGQLVVAPAGNGHDKPILAPLGNGAASVAWIGPSSNANRLYLQTIDAKGRFQRGQGVVFSVGFWDEWNPKLVGNGEGMIWAGWEDYRNHTHWQVFLGMMDRNGHSSWPGGEVALAPVLADQAHLSFVEDGRKGAFAVWTDNRSGRPGVYAQQVDLGGHLLLGDSGKTIADDLVDPSDPQIVLLSPAHAAIFFADQQKKGHWALYWQALSGTTSAPTVAPAAAPPPTESGKGGGEEVPQGAGEGMVP